MINLDDTESEESEFDNISFKDSDKYEICNNQTRIDLTNLSVRNDLDSDDGGVANTRAISKKST